MCRHFNGATILLSLLLSHGAIVSLAKKQQQPTSFNERILRRIYRVCDGENWVNNENWMSLGDNGVCDWYGVTCNEDENVSSLSLPKNGLKCKLPKNTFTLPYLTYLDLGSNHDLDVEFDGIPKKSVLETLKLDNTGVKSIDGVSILKNLNSLVLSGNDVTGSIPSDVYRLKSLTSLDLSYNFFTGTISEDISKFSQIQTLILSNNILTGPVPSTVGELSQVSTLDISRNLLSGAIPSSINSLREISILALNFQSDPYGAGITGALPSFSSSPHLSFLNLSRNRFSGSIPLNLLAAADTTSYLTMIDVSANTLTGTVPESLSRFQVLRIYMINNKIEALHDSLCQRGLWFFNEVQMYGCDAILCPPGTHSVFGRQVSQVLPCARCNKGDTEAPFYGTVECGTYTVEAEGGKMLSFSEDEKEIQFKYTNSRSKEIRRRSSDDSRMDDDDAESSNEQPVAEGMKSKDIGTILLMSSTVPDVTNTVIPTMAPIMPEPNDGGHNISNSSLPSQDVPPNDHRDEIPIVDQKLEVVGVIMGPDVEDDPSLETSCALTLRSGVTSLFVLKILYLLFF